MSDNKATLSVNGKSIELPVYSGTVGPEVIDVRGLVAEGVFTYDPGFVSTAACESAITYIDGENGVLLHRGYPIEELAEKIRLPRNQLPVTQRRITKRRGRHQIQKHGEKPHHAARPDDSLF